MSYVSPSIDGDANMWRTDGIRLRALPLKADGLNLNPGSDLLLAVIFKQVT